MRPMSDSKPFGLSLSKPSTEHGEVPSLRSGEPFDFAQGERMMGGRQDQ